MHVNTVYTFHKKLNLKNLYIHKAELAFVGPYLHVEDEVEEEEQSRKQTGQQEVLAAVRRSVDVIINVS